MASRLGRSTRHRSSTAASRGLHESERDSITAALVEQLFAQDGISVTDSLSRTCITVDALSREFASQSSAKDTFRHADGLERTLAFFETNFDVPANESIKVARAYRAALLLLKQAMKDHRGNEKYFANYLKAWPRLKQSLKNYVSALLMKHGELDVGLHLATLFEGLLSLSLDGRQSSTSSEVSNVNGGNDEGLFEAFTLDGGEVVYCPPACGITLQLALQCLRYSDEKIASPVPCDILQLFSAIARSNSRNLNGLWQSGALTDLFAATEDGKIGSEANAHIHSLVESLASLGFGSLGDVAALFRRSCESERTRKLLLDSLKQSKQPSFVQFDLSFCGFSSIEFPSLARTFPSPNGYTLSAWLRIDTFDSSCHTTIFGAFDASQACFILMYLEKDSHQLILQTSITSSRPSVRFKSSQFSPNKWYHLVLAHKKNPSDPRQSSAALFVDGEFQEQVKCAYPEAPPEIDDRQRLSSQSSGSSSSPRTQKPVQAFFGTPRDLGVRLGRNEITSRWSLANAHLYSIPLTDEYIAVQYHLGPRYNGNMQDCLGPLLTYRASAELNRYNELLHPEKSDKSDIIAATEGHGSNVVHENKFLISLSPEAIIQFDGVQNRKDEFRKDLDRKAWTRYQHLAQHASAVAINVAISPRNEAISRSYGTGILTGDPVVCLPQALDDASWCLAGSLPVLIRLLESATSKDAFLECVQIFFECVRHNWRISEAMERGNGFGVLAILIRDKLGFESIMQSGNLRKPSTSLGLEDAQSIQMELLQLVLNFVGYDKEKAENSMIVNPMAYRVLLLDFDTWRRCDVQTQKLYYKQLTHFVSHNRHQSFNQKRLIRMRVVRKLIEALKSEDFVEEVMPSLMEALKSLLESPSPGPFYRDLAMFAAYGLQDERAVLPKPPRNMASIVALRQKSLTWAKSARGSLPASPGGVQTPKPTLSRAELAIHVLRLLDDVLSDDSGLVAARRFHKAVPNRWILHLLAETDERIVTLTSRILSKLLYALGQEFKGPFMDKNGGFVTLRSRLKSLWRLSSVWLNSFAIFFGRPVSDAASDGEMTVFSLITKLNVDDTLKVTNPEMLPSLMALLETGLRYIVNTEEPAETDVRILKTVVQFLSELYNRSTRFREFASNSRYVQEILFVLFPILVGSDRLSAELELQSNKESLSFKGEEVQMRPHSNSLGERPPSVRSLNLDGDKRTPSPRAPKRIEAPRRPSSFVLLQPDADKSKAAPAQFNAVMAPNKTTTVAINIGNSIVEALLEVAVNMFIDLVLNKDRFNGIGLFLKVPPGFREHQAYFESYILVHLLTQLWQHVQLDQTLLIETRVITNLSRFCTHMSEAVFEGWFIDGAQPLLDFSGKLLEYYQQPDIAAVKTVRLCSQNINAIRVVFMRVCLWRLSELDELEAEQDAITFLNQMNYWQTILFASDNRETVFTRLICFLLHMKLVSSVNAVRLASTRLWRAILVQKPTETATLLTLVMGSEQRHLSTGFMKLLSMDDEEFVHWVDENRTDLDKVFLDALSKPWEEFVTDENRRTEESAKNRLSKRKDKLRQWQIEESSADDFMHRYEVSTNHWRSNVHAQERLKLQRSIQDHQESISHLSTVFTGIERAITQPAGLDPFTGPTKWQLDATEAVNRMRLRTLPDTTQDKGVLQPKRKASERGPDQKLAINTQLARVVKEDILSPLPGSPQPAQHDGPRDELNGETGRTRSDSASNSQLLEGGFEMVEDPREADDGLLEDKNRKVMTSLQRGDMVQQLYNISRIIGLEACEGLLVIGKNCLYMQDNFFQRSDGEIVSVTQAPDDERDPYVQLISGKDVGSHRTKHSIGDQETRHWTWAQVLSISKRRFLFRDVSIEVFFADGRSFLLTCMSSKVRDDLYSAIANRAPHVHSSATIASEDAWRLDTLRNPEEGPRSLGSKVASVFNTAPSFTATKKWTRGEMSNFQYLMLVNTMAGRTFNDLTQYPVFPWVLADYSSEELDLNDRKTFRDLSKPMGCQTRLREVEYQDRFKQFAEMGDHNAPPFHYGTHYSSAMIVSSYLIRLQPFVQSYLLLQGGSFDHADRLFDSIEKAWLSASRDNMTDVRELTPEFFYLPEFLININGFDFGAKQATGEVVNDVKLPPWAKGSPHIFIAKHREALESPYVSQHLDQWIDLVFGFKQRGEAAVEATNVFQHLSYQGAKDLDSIDDPVERLASIGIIHSFGQTPYQIFQRAHPSRENIRAAASRLDTLAESLIKLHDPLFESDEKITGLNFSSTQERLLCTGPCKLNLLPNCDRFVQWDFADHSLRFFSANTKRSLGLYENMHVGPITTVTLADSKTIITAGADCTIGLWGVSTSRDQILLQPKTYLFGHRAPVVILAASRVFSTLLSASSDGAILIWSLNRYQSIRVLRPPGSPTIQAARISNVSGHILICQDQHLLLYTLNGQLLVDQKVCEGEPGTDRLVSCAFYEGAGNEWLERELIFTGHTHGVANIWTLTTLNDGSWYLLLVKRLIHTDPGRDDGVNSLAAITAILPMAHVVYTGDDEGRVWEWDCVVRHSSFSTGGR